MSAEHLKRFEGLPRQTLSDGRIVVEAATHTAKRRGLAKLDALPPDLAMHFPKCTAIHTFGMRFPLDLIWLARDGSLVRVDRDVAPKRMRTCRQAASVVETLSGEADAFLAAGLA
jgi:uncharacterized membrane protein (UPF0127 family)